MTSDTWNSWSTNADKLQEFGTAFTSEKATLHWYLHAQVLPPGCAQPLHPLDTVQPRPTLLPSPTHLNILPRPALSSNPSRLHRHCWKIKRRSNHNTWKKRHRHKPHGLEEKVSKRHCNNTFNNWKSNRAPPEPSDRSYNSKSRTLESSWNIGKRTLKSLYEDERGS